MKAYKGMEVKLYGFGTRNTEWFPASSCNKIKVTGILSRVVKDHKTIFLPGDQFRVTAIKPWESLP
jgi:hypothetical protein